jgi:MoxR-like ATPase
MEQDPKGMVYQAAPEGIERVNAALALRTPLLITGRPGCGKSSVAYAVAYELKLGSVLRWPITTQTTLQDGLYQYDAESRVQEASLHRVQFERQNAIPDIGNYIRLGPLGTALLPRRRPRVLLIDQVDQGRTDLFAGLVAIVS